MNSVHILFILLENGFLKASFLQKMLAWCLRKAFLVWDFFNCSSSSQNACCEWNCTDYGKSKKRRNKEKSRSESEVEHLTWTSYLVLSCLILLLWHPSLPCSQRRPIKTSSSLQLPWKFTKYQTNWEDHLP